MGCLRTAGGVLVGVVVLIGFGSFALATVPLLSGGTIPPERILLATGLSLLVALASAWSFRRLIHRAWRLGLLAIPLVVLVGASLLLASTLPIRAACSAYHTDAVCPPWAR
ncbi:MAG TPA: hypothetical protein VKF59_23380 [Candidatus Dormibacteraeota bacterium]|nr:hypothetical protein [Candidatus Dormibacteraeota bacterium]